MSELKFLVIGLGSMGKRRVRNLLALGYSQIVGIDPRKERCEETRDKYGVSVASSLEEGLHILRPDIWIISTPPQHHMEYAYLAYHSNTPAFIEASVTDSQKIRDLYELCKKKNLVILPSCTMLFYPGPITVKSLLRQGIIGDILSSHYHSGQYLPDWHPWETIQDYYVSARETGGCREIVPFELTWLSDLWGIPTVLSCVRKKLSDMPADIDDFYHAVLLFSKIVCTFTVEVLSRPKSIRELRVLGTNGILEWSAEQNRVRYCNTENPEWISYPLYTGTIEAYYINPEEPYVQELKLFVEAVQTESFSIFPNSLLKDYGMLQTLLRMEKLS